MSGTVSVVIVRLLLSALERAGVDRAELGLDLPADVLASPDGRLPANVVFRLIEEAPKLAGDELFCLRTADEIPFGALEVLDFSMRSSENLAAAMGWASRYYALLDDRTELSLERHGALAHLIGKNLSQPPAPRAATELLFAMTLARGRSLGGLTCPLHKVCFFQGPPGDPEGHERFFGAPVFFSQPRDELVFDASWLDVPCKTPDPELVRFFERYASGFIEKLAGPKSFVDSVRRAITDRMAGGDPALESVAKTLGTSERTLQRKLADSGTSFKDLVDDVKRSLALELLTTSAIPIAEVGFVLGFSDTSTFYRAFRRWTGRTPADFRRAHR